MGGVFNGTDYAWLAVDAHSFVGWFTINGSGPLPDVVGKDAGLLAEREDKLGEWIRSSGRPFRFGAGDSMWLDAAAVGLFPFDFDDKAQWYRLVAVPQAPLLDAQVPRELRDLITVRLPTATFESGLVTHDDVGSALPR